MAYRVVDITGTLNATATSFKFASTGGAGKRAYAYPTQFPFDVLISGAQGEERVKVTSIVGKTMHVKRAPEKSRIDFSAPFQFQQFPVPATWTCNAVHFGSGDGCHCNCGAFANVS